MPALAAYEAALASGRAQVVNTRGDHWPLPVHLWSGPADGADQALLERCCGPTLDVGCGPGRMVAALTQRGTPALGIDISRTAVRLTANRGALALRRNVFDDLPGIGRWRSVLLADGNIGIGGDPVRLLRRCVQLLAPNGSVLLDVEPPGGGVLVEKIRIEHATGSSGWFQWCWVSVDAVAPLAEAASLVMSDVWLAGDRWQVELTAQK